MRPLTLFIGAVFLNNAARPVLALEPVTLHSRSGQFLVQGLPQDAPLITSAQTAAVSYVRLDPALLAVSCERIKQALLDELGMKDEWRGAVSIFLHPVGAYDEPIDITSMHYPDGWKYRLTMSDQVDRARLVKALVQVSLLEIANRKAGDRSAELPPWLAEGLAAHLQASALSSLTLEPQTSILRQGHRRDPLQRVRELLRARTPLTLNELNWPTEEQFTGENAEVYQASAQLLVHELLRLKNGQACLREMLARLPEYFNWQTAFLRAFQSHFQRLIDLDKWWALNVIHSTGREPTSAWTREETWRQLDETLLTPAQVRLKPAELPLTTTVKLQRVITEWDDARQVPLLRQKINLLQALRLRAPADLVKLVDDYRGAIEAYLQRPNRSMPGPSRTMTPANGKAIARETLKRLDELDVQRELLRRQTNAPSAAQLTRTP